MGALRGKTMAGVIAPTIATTPGCTLLGMLTVTIVTVVGAARLRARCVCKHMGARGRYSALWCDSALGKEMGWPVAVQPFASLRASFPDVVAREIVVPRSPGA